MKKIIFLAALLLTCSLTAQAVIVDNHSFELPGTGKIGTDWGLVPGWSSDNLPSDSGVESAGTSTDGDWNGFLMGGDPSVWQLTGHTIAAGEDFELLIDMATTGGATTVQMSLYYDDGGVRTTAATQQVTLGEHKVYAEYSLLFSADSLPASIGNQIGIEIVNDAGWMGLDNVRLVPEPATMILLGLGGLCLRRRK